MDWKDQVQAAKLEWSWVGCAKASPGGEAEMSPEKRTTRSGRRVEWGS